MNLLASYWVPFWCSDTKDTLYLIYGDSENKLFPRFIVHLCFNSEINTIIKTFIDTYIHASNKVFPPSPHSL